MVSKKLPPMKPAPPVTKNVVINLFSFFSSVPADGHDGIGRIEHEGVLIDDAFDFQPLERYLVAFDGLEVGRIR